LAWILNFFRVKNHLLLIPEKVDLERELVADAWKDQGGLVKRIGKFWIKPQLQNHPVAIYGNDTFSLVLAQVLNINLISPKDELIAGLPKTWTRREINLLTKRNIENLAFPTFCKPLKPKLFPAKIYSSLSDLVIELENLDDVEIIIQSETIEIDQEVRAFILNGKIQDLSYYQGQGSIEAPKTFIQDFLKVYAHKLPKTFVVDIGHNISQGWFIIEFNATWGAGLNGCEAEKVIDSIRDATLNGRANH